MKEDVYYVSPQGKVARVSTVSKKPNGILLTPDGKTLDEHGNLYVACGGAGVKVYSPQGKAVGAIEVPYASNRLRRF